MSLKLSPMGGLVLLSLIFSAGALYAQPVVLLVTDSTSTGVGNNNDDTLVEMLEDAGYTVDRTCMDMQCRESAALSPWAPGNEAKLAALHAADLILVSRRTNSGDYDADRQRWNELQKPLLLMSPFLSRGAGDNRWGWHSSGGADAPLTSDEIEIEPGQEDHPLVRAWSSPIQVADLSATPTPGLIPKAFFLPNSDGVPGSTVLARMLGANGILRPFLMEIPAGVDLSAGNTAGGPYGVTGAQRVLLAHWGYDIVNANTGNQAQFSDFVTEDYKCLVLGTIARMLGYTGNDPCGEPTQNVCVPVVERAISGNPYSRGDEIAVTLTASSVSGPMTIDETFPQGWSLLDAGGGAVNGNVIRFNRSTNGAVTYRLRAPAALHVTFSGTFQAAFPACELVNGVVRGDITLRRLPPGDEPVTGGVGNDIGAPGVPGGQEEISASPLSIQVFASGRDIWDADDEGRMVSFGTFNEFDIRCVASAFTGEHTWGKAGLMARTDPFDPSSAYAFLHITGANGTDFQYRDDAFLNAANRGQTGAAGILRELRLLRRSGKLVEAFARRPGEARWQLFATRDMPNLSSAVGVAVTSHIHDQISGARFENIVVSEDPPPALGPVTGFTCSRSGDSIVLRFTPPAGAAEIDVLRDGALLATIPGTSTSYTDESPAAGDAVYQLHPFDGTNLPGPAAICLFSPCAPETGAQEAELVAAFAFGDPRIIGSREFPTYNDPSRNYTKVLQTSDPFSIAYDPGLGFGYEIFYGDGVTLPLPRHAGRGGWEMYGPMDESPNNRAKFPDTTQEQLYDTFIGAKTFLNQNGCDQNIVFPPDPNVPCAEGGLEPDGIIFRIDVPNGDYRFVGAFGDADNNHAHRILVEDGGEGPPTEIGSNYVVLVHNFDQAQQAIGEADAANRGEGVYARVGFDGKIPPPGDGVPPSPQFVNMDDEGFATEDCPSSPTLKVTQGYIRIHQLQANSNAGAGGPRDPNGGDAVILELWRVSAGPPPGTRFVRGDADSSGAINLTDAVRVLNFLFTGGPAPACLDAADADDSGVLAITDAIRILGWLFTGGLPPLPPSPSAGDYSPADCGLDPTADGLDCAVTAAKCR
jgi:hypothetical protein